jgi:glycerol-3-phosphate dehydrogenase (NAD(P)+)
MGMVVEGVATTKAAYELAQEKDIDMPITAAIYRVLFENARVDEVVEELMLRDRKAEHSTSKMTAEEE